jgi:hypothetical protein
MTKARSLSKSVFREAKVGGRFAPRSPIPGEVVGESRVLERLGTREGAIIWSVTCSCARIQIRSSNQINRAIRRGHSLLCPDCISEYRRGSAAYVVDQRSQARLERVLDGGPIWSDFETADLQAQVLADLEEEFGPLDKDSHCTIAEMQISVGWPSGRKIPTAEEKEATAVKRADYNAYHRASTFLERLDKKASRAEIEALRKRARDLAEKVKNEELFFKISELQQEQWKRVMDGEDIVNPDRVTKKAARERLAITKAQSRGSEEDE